MRCSGLLEDKRGSVDLVQLVLVLPIFVLLLYGSFEVWKVVSVKQSLGAATYQCARCRSVYNDCNGVSNITEDNFNCEWVLLNELADNSFIDWEDLVGIEIRYRDERRNVICVVAMDQTFRPYRRSCPEDPARLDRNEKFSVEAELFLPWPIFFSSLFSQGGEASESVTLSARHRSYIECGPRWRPTPTPTPTPTP
ncbi:MAG: pilus assembly protein [Anaerolineae bacterium]|jgi:hypothetical protein